MPKPTTPVLQTGNALASGLIRCYPIHEGSGSTLHDLASGNRDATTRTAGSTANATWGTAAGPGAFITLNGTNQDAAAPDAGMPTGAAARTLAFLFRASEYSAGKNGFIVGYGTADNSLFAVGTALPTAGADPQSFRATTYGHGAGGTTDLVDNAWHLCVATIDPSGNLRMYVDGVPIAISENGTAPSTAPFPFSPLTTALSGTMFLGQAGGSGNGVGLNFKGDLAGVWAWDRALSGPEITSFAADPWQMVRADSGGGGGLTPPTGYTLAASPPSVAVGNAATITATLAGGSYLAAPLVITLGAVAGVAFGGTITISNGSTTGSTTATPSTAGTKSITATHAGGGFTGGDGSTSFTATTPPDPPDGLPYGEVFDLLATGRSGARARAITDAGSAYPGLDWSTSGVRELGSGQYGVALTLPAGVELWVQVDDGAGGPSLFDRWDGVGSSGAGGGTGGYTGPTAAQIAAAVLSRPARSTDPADSLGGVIFAAPTEDEFDAKLQAKAAAAIAATAAKLPASPPAGYASSSDLASVASGVATLGTAGVKLRPDGLESVVVEAGLNARQALSIAVAAAAGVISGAGTGQVTIRGGGSNANRISATTDAQGNRQSVALTPPPAL